ncbi:MAG: hypothetical protein H0U26_05880 [Acidimicrobiia bacterium]|nr:hypothetical protein [Acidimicrobiia bacterium]
MRLATRASGYPCVWLLEGLGPEALTHASLLLEATADLAVATGIASIWARDAFADAGTRLLRAAHVDRDVGGDTVGAGAVVDGPASDDQVVLHAISPRR